MLARQVDDAVGKPEGDALGGEIGYRNALRIDLSVIAVFAAKHDAAVGTDLELPHLKFLGGDRLRMALGKGDLVEQPVSASRIGDIFRTIGEGNARHEAVPVPVLGR